MSNIYIKSYLNRLIIGVDMKIADLGCGKSPWLLRNYFRKIWKFGTPLSDAYCGVPAGTTYFCVEVHRPDFDYISGKLKEFSAQYPDLVMGDIEFICADARRSGLQEQSLDAVILSDVVSAPPPRHADLDDYGKPGLTNNSKRQIVDSAIDLLRLDGRLIVATYQTPVHGAKIFEYLLQTQRLALLEQHGSPKIHGSLDNYIYELVFGKTNVRSTARPKITPLNARQIAPLRRSDLIPMDLA